MGIGRGDKFAVFRIKNKLTQHQRKVLHLTLVIDSVMFLEKWTVCWGGWKRKAQGNGEKWAYFVAIPEQRARIFKATLSPRRIFRIGPRTMAQTVTRSSFSPSLIFHSTLDRGQCTTFSSTQSATSEDPERRRDIDMVKADGERSTRLTCNLAVRRLH